MKLTDEEREAFLDSLMEAMKVPGIPPGGVVVEQPVGVPGWICPVCGSGNSPYSNRCPCLGVGIVTC